jgi:tetratricopeptide (TPR) repeat protein
MSQLTVESLVMPAANLGGENPLAPLRPHETASAAGLASTDADDYPDRGNEHSILPYRLQDQYDRRRSPRAFKAIVLENQHLRATFLPELGGRLWSLQHKSAGRDAHGPRELLFVNPIFQPANLAVRDAWFAGGVEWNISIIGHSPFTCAPLFAARVIGDDGNPVLRLYEWDRIRRVPFQIDCWLPDDSPFLFVRVRITNPHDHAIPMYWWSNIAVPEGEDVRVLAPANQAYRHDYDGSLVEHDVPIYDGADVTYPARRRSAADLYFRIPPGHRPWIAALDRDGVGLMHTSTDRLRGRKMFNWGTDAGGRRWQEFLSGPGQAYIEIQGGLAPTQGDYLAMPAGATWTWLEAYGPLQVDPVPVHHANWQAAHAAVEQELERRLPRERLDAELERSADIAQRQPAELLHTGSGWGALELHRRRRAAESSFTSVATPFPDGSLGADQAQWLTLLNEGALPPRDPATADPGSLMVQPEWRELLEDAVRAGRGTHWFSWYHLGVMRYRAGDRAAARDAWLQSLRCEPSAWAYRDLAVVARDETDEETAAELWLKAAALRPDLVSLVIECASALLGAGRADHAIAFIDSLAGALQQHGRLRLLRARAALAVDDLETVARYFEQDPDVANIREKETTLSDLWFAWHERRLARERNVAVDAALRRQVRLQFPPPPRFDFRLIAEPD